MKILKNWISEVKNSYLGIKLYLVKTFILKYIIILKLSAKDGNKIYLFFLIYNIYKTYFFLLKIFFIE